MPRTPSCVVISVLLIGLKPMSLEPPAAASPLPIRRNCPALGAPLPIRAGRYTGAGLLIEYAAGVGGAATPRDPGQCCGGGGGGGAGDSDRLGAGKSPAAGAISALLP